MVGLELVSKKLIYKNWTENLHLTKRGKRTDKKALFFVFAAFTLVLVGCQSYITALRTDTAYHTGPSL